MQRDFNVKQYEKKSQVLKTNTKIITSISRCKYSTIYSNSSCSLRINVALYNRLCIWRIWTHQLILICRDSGENGLRKDKRLMLFLLKVGDMHAAVVSVSTTNQVYPRLIPVHRIQYNLQQRKDLPFDYCSSRRD